MIRLAVVGLGKMGISHLSIIKAHPRVDLAAICDSSGYLLDLLSKYTGVVIYSDYEKMLAEVPLDAVIIATPSRHHVAMVKAALDRGIHVLCEKPFTLDAADAAMLAELAASRKLANQVGYHYRFVGAFQEVKRLLDANAIGRVTHVLAEAYGPVVLKAKGTTWRTQAAEGGGCLYDYAAHPINLVNWYLGMPQAVSGTVLNKIFSRDTDDEVYSTFHFAGGVSGQLSVNWSDDSYRKMTTKITLSGTRGRLYADRQEVQLFVRPGETPPSGYGEGWNVRYTTELTEPTWFYLRGEEYSAQLDYFVGQVEARSPDNVNSFASAAETDQVIGMMLADEAAGPREATAMPTKTVEKRGRFSLIGALRGR